MSDRAAGVVGMPSDDVEPGCCPCPSVSGAMAGVPAALLLWLPSTGVPCRLEDEFRRSTGTQRPRQINPHTAMQVSRTNDIGQASLTIPPSVPSSFPRRVLEPSTDLSLARLLHSRCAPSLSSGIDGLGMQGVCDDAATGQEHQPGQSSHRKRRGRNALQVTRTSERKRGCASVYECRVGVSGAAAGRAEPRQASRRSKINQTAGQCSGRSNPCGKRRENWTVHSTSYTLSIGVFWVCRSLFLRAQGQRPAIASALPTPPRQPTAGQTKGDEHERRCANGHANTVRMCRRGGHRTGRRGRSLCHAHPGRPAGISPPRLCLFVPSTATDSTTHTDNVPTKPTHLK
jgi:hypothetical protein